MPSNLNALIRYKTINSCLYGGRRKWTLKELIEKCSEALAEYRGRYEPVSERTLRDDIRVMRSEILGFSAPIRQKSGLYYYDDPHYSILSVSFSDSGLILKVIKLLSYLRTEVSHPELEIILEKLTSLAGKKPREETMEEKIEYDLGRPEKKRHYHKISDRWLKSIIMISVPGEPEEEAQISGLPEKSSVRFSLEPEGLPCWGDVLGLIILKNKNY